MSEKDQGIRLGPWQVAITDDDIQSLLNGKKIQILVNEDNSIIDSKGNRYIILTYAPPEPDIDEDKE